MFYSCGIYFVYICVFDLKQLSVKTVSNNGTQMTFNVKFCVQNVGACKGFTYEKAHSVQNVGACKGFTYEKAHNVQKVEKTLIWVSGISKCHHDLIKEIRANFPKVALKNT